MSTMPEGNRSQSSPGPGPPPPHPDIRDSTAQEGARLSGVLIRRLSWEPPEGLNLAVFIGVRRWCGSWAGIRGHHKGTRKAGFCFLPYPLSREILVYIHLLGLKRSAG